MWPQIILIIAHLTAQGVVSQTIEVEVNGSRYENGVKHIPKGSTSDIMCRAPNQKLVGCSFKFPNKPEIKLKEKADYSKYDFQYFGKYENGECGIKYTNFPSEVSGETTCFLEHHDAEQEKYVQKSATMNLLVTVEPAMPNFTINPFYKDGDEIDFVCKFPGGIPKPDVTISKGADVYSLKQGVDFIEIPITVSRDDNKKNIFCKVTHEKKVFSKHETINIHFAPVQVGGSKEPNCNLLAGETGVIKVKFLANPKPVVTWTIDGQLANNTALVGEQPEWEAHLTVTKLTVGDNKAYQLRIVNNYGDLELNPCVIVTEPDNTILIVVTIAIIVILGGIAAVGVLYARKTEKFCFKQRGQGFNVNYKQGSSDD